MTNILLPTNDPTPAAMPSDRRRSWPSPHAMAPFALAIAATVWFFRATFVHGSLPGDVVDARWSLTVLEHWSKVWSGDAAIRDLGVFHPIDTTLGLSDPFLVEGQFHALARMVGADPVPAWFFAHLITFLIGALGVAALSRRVLKDPVPQCVLVVTTVLSYPMVVQMSHVQTYGFLWMAWIIWAVHGLLWPTGPRTARTSAIVLLVLPPLIAMSSWYGLVLGATVLLVLAAVTAVLSGFRPASADARRVARTLLASFRSPPVVAAAVAGIALWGLAAWIFLPSFGLLPTTRFVDVIELSPRWSDLLNASLSGGGVWSPLYDRYYSGVKKTGDTEMGFTPLLAVALVAATVVALRRLIAARDDAGTRTTFVHVLSCAFTILVMATLLLVDERGNGLYGFLFTNVPPFAAIRSPFRVQILLYPLAVYSVLKLVEALAGSGRALRRPALVAGAVSCVIGGLLLVEMRRPSNSHWTGDQVVTPRLGALVDDIERSGCDVLLMDVPVGPSFVTTQIDATLLSMLSDVPTVHGYGRASPEEHPGWDAPPEELLSWLRDEGVEGPVCLVSPRGLDVDR